MGILTPSTSRPPKRSRAFVLIVLASVLLIGGWLFTNRKDDATIIIIFPSGRQLEAEVADTPEKQLFGLAFRDGLPAGWAMLYIFETADYHRIGTKGYKVAVDLVWADEARRVVHVLENAQPCKEDPCPSYGPPPEKARYVLQAAAGIVREENVGPGIELKFVLKL